MEGNFGYAILAALVAGGWYLFTAWPLQLLAALRKKEAPWQGFVIGLLQIWRFISDHPLPVGGLTGLVIGDFATGIQVGALIQLMFLGVFIIGAAVPPRPMVATVLSVIFVSVAGVEHGQVIALAIPISVLSMVLFLLNITINSFFYNKFALQAAEAGDDHKLELWHVILQPINITVINAVPAFLGVYYGTEAVQRLIGAIPEWLNNGLELLPGLLPIVGFALLVYTLNPGSLFVLFIVGFALGGIMEIPALTFAAIVVGIVFFIQKIRSSGEEEVVDAEEAESKEPLSFKEHLTMWWRNLCWYYVASFEVLGGWGFAYQMVPVIREAYKDDPEGKIEALKRHIAFWNTNVYAGGVVPGMVAAMEKERARDKDVIDGEAIQGIKVATMGPVAGIGDALYHASLIPIILALGTTMVQDGVNFGWAFSTLALILLFGFSIWYLVKLGYNLGAEALTRLRGVVDKIAEGAKFVGLILAGNMVATLAQLNLDLTYTTGEEVIDVQELLDGLMPKLPVLFVFLLAFYFLRRGVNAIWLILGLMVFAVLGAIAGFLVPGPPPF